MISNHSHHGNFTYTNLEKKIIVEIKIHLLFLQRLALTSFSQSHTKQEMPTLLSADNKTKCASLDPLDGLNADIREAFIVIMLAFIL